jgi:hypothetical protein
MQDSAPITSPSLATQAQPQPTVLCTHGTMQRSRQQFRQSQRSRQIGDGDPVARTKALIEAQGAKFGAQAPQLPSSGTVTAGSLYQFEEKLWSVIQTFSRTTYPAHPSTYPALIRRVHVPGEVEPWKQPLDQFDAYKLVNPFNGLPDKCTTTDSLGRSRVLMGQGITYGNPECLGGLNHPS